MAAVKSFAQMKASLCFAGVERADEFQGARITAANPAAIGLDAMPGHRFAHAGDARVHRRHRERAGDEAKPFATELDEMFGDHVTAGHVPKI